MQIPHPLHGPIQAHAMTLLLFFSLAFVERFDQRINVFSRPSRPVGVSDKERQSCPRCSCYTRWVCFSDKRYICFLRVHGVAPMFPLLSVEHSCGPVFHLAKAPVSVRTYCCPAWNGLAVFNLWAVAHRTVVFPSGFKPTHLRFLPKSGMSRIDGPLVVILQETG